MTDCDNLFPLILIMIKALVFAYITHKQMLIWFKGALLTGLPLITKLKWWLTNAHIHAHTHLYACTDTLAHTQLNTHITSISPTYYSIPLHKTPCISGKGRFAILYVTRKVLVLNLSSAVFLFTHSFCWFKWMAVSWCQCYILFSSFFPLWPFITTYNSQEVKVKH